MHSIFSKDKIIPLYPIPTNIHHSKQWRRTNVITKSIYKNSSSSSNNNNINITLNTLHLIAQSFATTHAKRRYCTERSKYLTHVDETGCATMVDVSTKSITTREACACATVVVGAHISQLILANNIRKGDVLSVAQIAGILAAKKTSELIPLCHNIALSSVKVTARLNVDEQCVELLASVRCCGQTGVEMEALTAVAIAALTVYDMCKAVSHDITISNVRLLSKTGGKRDFKHMY